MAYWAFSSARQSWRSPTRCSMRGWRMAMTENLPGKRHEAAFAAVQLGSDGSAGSQIGEYDGLNARARRFTLQAL
ncbi:hypothetical protein BQ8482_280130 [Mesorhizobium delmotii]|uniref:Uncharacterized protein n=1 Tax=Mesorhizobium delmotii TaxID=1631247 RepID=A0A2P9AMM0_9HYPH|nr:hypothetical protein BQ8482_280130 [Mesorhizobium delmotii]